MTDRLSLAPCSFFANTLPVEWRLRWNWDWPLWLTVMVVASATVWVMLVYFRESSTASRSLRVLLGSLRLTALGLALLMFAQPAIEWFRQGRPRLVVLVDCSQSMSTMDRYRNSTDDISRLVATQQFLVNAENPLLERWRLDYQIEVIKFGDSVELLTAGETSLTEKLRLLEPEKEAKIGTRLGDAVDYALRELSGPTPLGLIVLSDGIVTRGQTLKQAAERARRLRVPLYTVAVGSERVHPDIILENLLVEEIVFPGDRLQVEATVRATGYAGQSAEVVLRDLATGDLASTTIALPADGKTQAVRLAVRPDKPGQLALELVIQPREDEQDIDNNRIRQIVEIRDEKIRVLLVDSQPSYEFRALKSLLERDPAVDLKVLLQEADADYSSVDDTAIDVFPTSEQKLFSYDVLILGDVDLGLLPRSIWPLVERFVTEHGGGLVGIAGPRFMPWAFRDVSAMQVLLPLELDALNPLRSQIRGTEAFAIVPTMLGLRTPSLQLGETMAESEQIWRGLPPVSWISRVDNIKQGAQILAELPGLTNRQRRPLPVILRHYVGAGEVLFHALDESWRWRWRTDDRYFARYWGQVVRRLGRGRLASGRQGVQLTSDRSIYEPGELVQLQVRFRNPSRAPAEAGAVVVQVQGETGPPRQLTLHRRVGRRGLFTARVENLPAGKYETLLVRPDMQGGAETTRFEIRQPPRELAELVVNRQGLSDAAELTGGKAFLISDASALSAALPPPRQHALEELPPRQFWNSHLVIGLFVMALTSEWILRRRYGML